MSNKFKDLYKKSIENPEIFWQEASKDIFWFKEPTKILNKSNAPFYKWFEDGVTNTCYNALDIHIDQGNGKRTALIYDSPITGNKSKFTYEELKLKVSRFAGALSIFFSSSSDETSATGRSEVSIINSTRTGKSRDLSMRTILSSTIGC